MLEALEVLEVILLGVPVLVFEFVGVDFLAGSDPGLERFRLGRFDLLEDVLGVDVWSSGFFIGRGSLHATMPSQCRAASLGYKPFMNL